MQSSTSQTRGASARRLLAVVAVLAALTAAAAALPSAPAQAQAPGDCVTAANRDHLDAGRATRTFIVYRAVGSGDSLGFSSFTTTSLQRSGSSWTRVDACAPTTTTTVGGTTSTTVDPGSRPPLEQRYTAIYETDSGLRGHTVYRPQDLSAVADPMPIVVWGNGACRADGTWFQEFLQPLAAHGVLVVASGDPGGSGSTDSDMLIDAIDWAVGENTRSSSKYNGRLDTDAITAMGQSCGGIEAIEASADDRVDSTVAWNSGLFGSGSKPELRELHGPTAWFTGGPSDIAYGNAVNDYQQVGTRIPSVLGHYGDVGHLDLFADPDIEREIIDVAADWLDATLYDMPQARAQFVGSSCGLCSGTEWDMSSKNW